MSLDRTRTDLPGIMPRRALLVAGVVMLAFNLRPAITGIAPVLNDIRVDYGLSATAAGILTMLPVAFLGICGAVAARLARRFGTEPAVAAALLLLACGSLLRGAGSTEALFAGTTLVGAGIGILGVLLPGIVKRDFPASTGGMTGLFTMVLVGGAAVGAGATIPLAHLLGGWEPALMAWAAPALLAGVVWLPQLARRRDGPRVATPSVSLWRDPLAWQVTLFMGLQSAVAHITMSWMPVVLAERGLSPATAGFVASVSIAAQMLTALVLPPLAVRRRSQSAITAGILALSIPGMGGIFFGPEIVVWPCAVMSGLSLGGTMGCAMAIIVLRARDGQTAAELSGMAQSAGYLVAATGPFMIGFLRDLSGGWTLPGIFFLVTALFAVVAAAAAGRPRFVGD